MRKLILLTTLFALLATAPAEARRTGGYHFDDQIVADKDTTLYLNGVGFLEKFNVDVYANTLYLKKKSQDGQAIIDADETMALRLHILYGNISLKELVSGLRDGFRYSTGRKPENLAPVKERSEKFLSWFDHKTSEYDTATFLYIPGQGTHVSMNNAYKGFIPGLDFKKALFGIWLCAKPANRPLKAGLLGLPAK
jgi:hypothetical protein